MKVVHVITDINRASGGPSRSSQGLVAGLNKAGVETWLVALRKGDEPWVEGVEHFEAIDGAGAFPELLQRVQPDIVHLHGIWNYGLHTVAQICRRWNVPYVIAPRGMLEPWSLRQKWLKKRIARFLYQDADLHHAAALHATADSEVAQFRKLGFKNRVIISPNGVNLPASPLRGNTEHGVTEKRDVGAVQSVNQSSQLKSPCLRTPCFAEGDNQEGATAGSNPLRGNTENGVTEERDVGAAQSVTQSSLLKSPCLRTPCFAEGERRALFVSRMHPKKGVLELVESWARVKPQGWCCELVYTLNGDAEREYEQKVKARVVELGMSYIDVDGTIHNPLRGNAENGVTEERVDFIFTGPLNDEAKWDAYARADLFVLPTYSENFGIVVAEALWVGLPVITTKGTPWSELEGNPNNSNNPNNPNNSRCGLWIDLPPKDSLDAALSQLLNLSTSQLRAMGANGHALVESKYTWSAACKSMVDGYRAILNPLRGNTENGVTEKKD